MTDAVYASQGRSLSCRAASPRLGNDVGKGAVPGGPQMIGERTALAALHGLTALGTSLGVVVVQMPGAAPAADGATSRWPPTRVSDSPLWLPPKALHGRARMHAEGRFRAGGGGRRGQVRPHHAAGGGAGRRGRGRHGHGFPLRGRPSAGGPRQRRRGAVGVAAHSLGVRQNRQRCHARQMQPSAVMTKVAAAVLRCPLRGGGRAHCG